MKEPENPSKKMGMPTRKENRRQPEAYRASQAEQFRRNTQQQAQQNTPPAMPQNAQDRPSPLNMPFIFFDNLPKPQTPRVDISMDNDGNPPDLPPEKEEPPFDDRYKNYRGNFFSTCVMPSLWTIGSVFSIALNIILITALLLLGRDFFKLKAMMGDQVVAGLYDNFKAMDQSHIQTVIPISQQLPVNFTLPINQATMVTLSQDTAINNARVYINTGGIIINSPANIVLPAGSVLPVQLKMDVPVSTAIPVAMNIPVDIALNQTGLHEPFIGLQQVIEPVYFMLQPQVKGPQDIAFCRVFPSVCALYFTP